MKTPNAKKAIKTTNFFLPNRQSTNIKYISEINIEIAMLFRAKYRPKTNDNVVQSKNISYADGRSL